MADEDLDAELELLQAVWPEVHIRRGAEAVAVTPGAQALVEVWLEPKTGGQDEDRYVRCEVVLEIPVAYPEAALRPALGASRGLSDAQRERLGATLVEQASALSGGPALYQLLEAAGEELTALNAPSGDCGICLGDLGEPGAPATSSEALAAASAAAPLLTRAPCFHTFHTACLASYWQSEWRRQADDPYIGRLRSRACSAEVLCPECRSPLPWEAVPQLHALVAAAAPRVDREAPGPAAASNAVHGESAAGGVAEEVGVEANPQDEQGGEDDPGSEPEVTRGEAEQEEAPTLFEVVHHCGTCYRLRPHWDAKLDKGQVHRGTTGVVAEFAEGDTTYIRPEGSKYWLPVKGVSANIKIVHLERQAHVAKVATPSVVREVAKGPSADAVAAAVREHTKSGDALVAFTCRPNARATQIVGVEAGEVSVQLAAPPREGEANAELLRLAGEAFRVSKSDVLLHSGATSRSKVVRLARLSAETARDRLLAHLAAGGGGRR